MVRIAIFVSVIAVLAWSGFWLYSRQARLGLIEELLAGSSDSGWVATHSSLDVGGYPNRVDVTINDLVISNPDLGVAWNLPSLQLLALSYRTDHLVVAFPTIQSLDYLDSRLTFNTANMLASIEIDRAGSNTLEQLIVEASQIDILGESGLVDSAADFLLAIREESQPPGSYRVSLMGNEGQSIRQGPSNLPEFVASMALAARVDGRVGFSTAIGQDSCMDGFSLNSLEMQAFGLETDRLSATLSGNLAFSQDGYPAGRLELEVNDTGFLMELLYDLGFDPGINRSVLDLMLRMIGEHTDDGKSLRFSLDIDDQAIALGDLKLGPVPQMPPVC